eukprot:scaffold19_cov114-Cylindrotheca_fusiformis.AAC.19
MFCKKCDSPCSSQLLTAGIANKLCRKGRPERWVFFGQMASEQPVLRLGVAVWINDQECMSEPFKTKLDKCMSQRTPLHRLDHVQAYTNNREYMLKLLSLASSHFNTGQCPPDICRLFTE